MKTSRSSGCSLLRRASRGHAKLDDVIYGNDKDAPRLACDGVGLLGKANFDPNYNYTLLIAIQVLGLVLLLSEALPTRERNQ